ncbi:MAG TPA: tetratricopeptide repeat protein [Gemmatimonadales bacterium]|jgi:tetratricopeptide (TPR) repeat protein|nr:tetratricopeptide repeat protein [Gemmatimonadales bacterium]
MSYQFTMYPTRTAGRGTAIVFAALVVAAGASYLFAACGERNPDQASAGESVVATPTPAPSPTPVPPVQPPTTPADFYKVGRDAWRAGDLGRAESAFVQVLALDSTHVKSRLYLSRVLLESGRAEDALVQIDAAIALDSSSSEPFRLQGRAYQALGRTDEAITAYKRAIVTNDGDVWALNNLGSLYIKLGRFEDALGPIARAIELEKNVAIFHNNLGTALEKTGHFTAAAEAYRGALAVEGTYGPAAENLARVEQLTEDPATPPVDLAAVSKQFQDQVAQWKQGGGGS